MVKKIISGGQRGVDQAALDAAIALGIPYGGKCPKGRTDENGQIPERFNQLEEVNGTFKTEDENNAARTKKNIEESDGTLIFFLSEKSIKDGTALTIQEAKRLSKPHLLIDLSKPKETNIRMIIAWAEAFNIEILNIAGPRESNARGIHQLSFHFLLLALPHIVTKGPAIQCRL